MRTVCVVPTRVVGVFTVASLVLLASCSADDEGTLVVDVVTDLIPVVEFAGVEVRVDTNRETLLARAGEDWSDGRRIAELARLPNGPLTLEVEAFSNGVPVAGRRVRVNVAGRTAATVVLARSCIGVQCPADGDSPTALACLGGRCVEEDCIDGTQPSCPTEPDCTDNSTCSAPQCASARCTEGGICVIGDFTCPNSEYCAPASGECTPIPVGPLVDAGNEGRRDSGIDLDAEPFDAMPPDTASLEAGSDTNSADDAALDSDIDAGSDAGVDGGGPSPCTEDYQCDDGNPCTVEVCSSGNCMSTDTRVDCAVVDISVSRHSCAVLESGALYCWGANSYGEVVDGDTDPRPTASLSIPTMVTDVETGGNHTCAVRVDGSPICWGNFLADVVVMPTSQPAVEIAAGHGLAGHTHTCIRLQSGAVECFGQRNQYGQLGDGGTDPHDTPAPVMGLTDAIAIGAGVAHSCAVVADRTAVCWGRNDAGQLGDGTLTDRLTPIPVSGLTDLVRIVGGKTNWPTDDDYTCALNTSGHVYCWGGNQYGQLGDGTTTNRRTPQRVVNLDAVSHVDTGARHACALEVDGDVKCWGDNSAGQLGNGRDESSLTPTLASLVGAAQRLDVGDDHACVVRTSGSVHCWGGVGSGQLGNGPSHAVALPERVSGVSQQVYAGEEVTCDLDSLGAARCWGRNDFGQLGDGTAQRRTIPAVVSGLSNVAQLATGLRHTCALLNDNTVRCWGINNAGQLGDGTMNDSLMPVVVSGVTNAVQVVVGIGRKQSDPAQGNACALLGDGSVTCWGTNVQGQLGNGTLMGSVTPTVVSQWSNVAQLSAGPRHMCARHVNSTISCSGTNNNGAIGDGTTDDRTVPTPVMNINDADFVGAGEAHSCALHRDGTVSCWGFNAHFQLGDGTNATSSLPVTVAGLAGVEALDVGGYHNCALRRGELLCWGFGTHGQLGDGLTDRRGNPEPVAGLSAVTAFSAGTLHTCAVEGDSLFCFGSDSLGQLGVRDHFSLSNVGGWQ